MASLLLKNDFAEEASEGLGKAEVSMEQALSCLLYGQPNDADDNSVSSEDAFQKMLADSHLDASTRQFMERTRQRLNANTPMTEQISQCENALEALFGLFKQQ